MDRQLLTDVSCRARSITVSAEFCARTGCATSAIPVAASAKQAWVKRDINSQLIVLTLAFQRNPTKALRVLVPVHIRSIIPGRSIRRCRRDGHSLEKRAIGFQERRDSAGTAASGAGAASPDNYAVGANRQLFGRWFSEMRSLKADIATQDCDVCNAAEKRGCGDDVGTDRFEHSRTGRVSSGLPGYPTLRIKMQRQGHDHENRQPKSCAAD